MLAPSVGLLAAVAAAGPPWALVCLRRCACSALFGMRAAPSRWCSGPWPSSALRLNRSRRPRLRSWRRPLGAKACAPAAGFRCAPPVPLLRRLARQRRRAGRPAGSRHPIFLAVVAVGSSRPTPPPSPRSPVLLRAAKVGGACFSGLWPPRRCGGAPLRSGPAPRFWPRGGAILFSLRRVWGLRRLRAALKVYRAARAAQCKCGVHGFAMNLCDSLPVATAPYYREARVTVVGRQTACGRHCFARRAGDFFSFLLNQYCR